MSEKFDGVRARWNGYQFYSRHGMKIMVPTFVLQQMPPMELDGELW
jgi:DNA ligase-1